MIRDVSECVAFVGPWKSMTLEELARICVCNRLPLDRVAS
jgi:hypothetical protein